MRRAYWPDGRSPSVDAGRCRRRRRAERRPHRRGRRKAATAGSGAGSGDPLLAGLRKAGLLRLLVLHLLGSGPSYGNQLMERVGELTGGLIAVNPNTMYPLLRALESEGLVAGQWEHPERRSRRFYELSEAGARSATASRRRSRRGSTSSRRPST